MAQTRIDDQQRQAQQRTKQQHRPHSLQRTLTPGAGTFAFVKVNTNAGTKAAAAGAAKTSDDSNMYMWLVIANGRSWRINRSSYETQKGAGIAVFLKAQPK